MLVAPVWRGQTWYPVLLGMFWNFPRLIALAPDLISKTKRCPNGDSPSTRHVTCLWEKFFSSSLLKETTKLLLQSWQSKSAQSYNSQFHKWVVWCAEMSCNPVSGPTSNVASLLAELYEEGYQAFLEPVIRLMVWQLANILYFAVYWKWPFMLHVGHHRHVIQLYGMYKQSLSA